MRRLAALLALVAMFAAPGREASARADVAEPQAAEAFARVHQALLRKKTQGQIDAYFLGDSITRRWHASEPRYRELQAHWNQSFRGWNAANFGWGGDTTQNILWRLEHGELDGVHPKVIVLMAGTNNVGSITPSGNDSERIEDITSGIRAILDQCRKRAPRATILLMGITPRNDNMAYMPIIDGVNARLAKLANGRDVRFINLNSQLADANGKLRDGMTDPDKLHLAIPAYQVWADALKPEFTQLLGPPLSVDRAPPPTPDIGTL